MARSPLDAVKMGKCIRSNRIDPLPHQQHMVDVGHRGLRQLRAPGQHLLHHAWRVQAAGRRRRGVVVVGGLVVGGSGGEGEVVGPTLLSPHPSRPPHPRSLPLTSAVHPVDANQAHAVAHQHRPPHLLKQPAHDAQQAAPRRRLARLPTHQGVDAHPHKVGLGSHHLSVGGGGSGQGSGME